MTGFIKKISVIIVFVFGIASFVSLGSLWALRQSNFYKPSFLANEVKEKKFDYIILGASTGLTTLNTIEIDSITKLKGINLSMDDTSLSTQYLMLQHFLFEGKKTDYCILAPSVKDFDNESNYMSGNDYRFLMYINRPYVTDYFKEFEGSSARLLYASKWMPFLGVSYYNTEVFYPSLVSVMSPSKRNRFDLKGNFIYPPSKKTSEHIENRKEFKVEFENSFFNKIKTLCDANDIQLICYLSPLEHQEAITESSQLKVINHTALLNDRKYFFDKVHVDGEGREIASRSLAQELMDIIDR